MVDEAAVMLAMVSFLLDISIVIYELSYMADIELLQYSQSNCRLQE